MRSGEARKVRVNNINGNSRTDLHNVLKGPSGGNRAREGILSQGRNIVGHGCGKLVSNIEVRIASIRVDTCEASVCVRAIRARVDGMCPSIGNQPLETIRQLTA